MTYILTGIPGVVCDIDNVLVRGKNQKEHDERLRTVSTPENEGSRSHTEREVSVCNRLHEVPGTYHLMISREEIIIIYYYFLLAYSPVNRSGSPQCLRGDKDRSRQS